ncbi:MAG: 7-cyano-7-deazaguanine synthase QueC [Nitrospinae bacterium]|nr:7-cyano-7-deazaguanine synthase QueC [Nitrospinota bacterium]
MNKQAIILLSGGLDSATALAIGKQSGFDFYAISFDYGQRHKVELEAAKKVAASLGVLEHKIFHIDISQFGGSALTDPSIKVPERTNCEEIGKDIPVTYVPARNTIFLSIALGWAESLGITNMFIGANIVDYSGYPDCRPEYIKAFEKMANLATKSGVEGQGIKVHAPLINLTKAEIIQKGIELGVDYSITISCYNPDDAGTPCGKCDSCLLREAGFKEALKN